jgi:hypothetical protein
MDQIVFIRPPKLPSSPTGASSSVSVQNANFAAPMAAAHDGF